MTAARELPRSETRYLDTGSTADWILGYTALDLESLILAALDIRKGRAAVVDNTRTMNMGAIGKVISSHSWLELVDGVEAYAELLLTMLRAMPQAEADTPVRVRLMDRSGRCLFDDWLLWRDVVRTRAEEHISQYANWLEQICGRSTEGELDDWGVLW